jgi:hypothetical protein
MTIEGVNPVRKVLADGSVQFRYYAWRGKGAPCFHVSHHKPVKHPYPRAFVEAYNEAIKTARVVRDDFNGLAQRYLASPAFAKLANGSERSRYVGLAQKQFGSAPLRVIADPRFRGELIGYRDSLAGTPRTADLAIQAVSVVLEHARNAGLLALNPAAGIPNLYRLPGDKRPWSDKEIVTFLNGAPEFIADAFGLIQHLALRRKDAAEITWMADRGTHIAWRTSKSGRAREAVIPILPDARAFLDDLKRRNALKLAEIAKGYARKHKDASPLLMASRYMLIAHKGQPWRDEASITKAFAKRWAKLEVKEFPSPHRLRNNAATAMMKAELDDRTIADAMGWSKEDVEEMRRVYVDREAVVSAAVIRLRDRK